MARILGGGMFGEMRGKLGSLVFARNRGGAYARSYAKPIDPATIAQLSARIKFGDSASNYHGMTPTQKTLWQNFANTGFLSKLGVAGAASGFNAFTSLLNVVENVKTLTNVTFGSLVGTSNDFAFSYTPPLHQLQANIQLSDNSIMPYGFTGFGPLQFDYNTNFVDISSNFTLTFSLSGITPGAQLNNFIDGGDNEFGFKIFMSNPVAQEGMFIQNPFLIDLGSTPGISITAPSAPVSSISILWGQTLNTGNYSALPEVGQFVQLSLYAVSTSGMLLRIGAQIVQVEQA